MRERTVKNILISFLPAAFGMLFLFSLWLSIADSWRSFCTEIEDGWTVDTTGTYLPAVMLSLTGGDVEVRLDHDVIYRNDAHPMVNLGLGGNRTFFVPLPLDSDGKTLHIEVSIDGREAHTLTQAPLFSEYEVLFRMYLLETFPPLIIGSFLTVFGIVFLFLTIGTSVALAGTSQHTLGAVICINLGLWLLSTNGLLSFFLRTPYDSIISVVTSILILPLLLSMLYTLRNESSYMETGIWIYASCMVLYLIFAVANFPRGTFFAYLVLILPIAGSLCLVIAQILNYYLSISASFARQQMYSTLAEKAYVDALTTLPNRKSADNVFRVLNSTSGSYCIVSLDLDNLKITNDRYGHDAGDRMLREAAMALNEYFGEKGFRARLGGDEFVIVLKHITKDVLEETLELMTAHLRRTGRRIHGIEYDISYGYAFKEESEKGTSSDVLQLADDRMYTQKRAKKTAKNRSAQAAL